MAARCVAPCAAVGAAGGRNGRVGLVLPLRARDVAAPGRCRRARRDVDPGSGAGALNWRAGALNWRADAVADVAGCAQVAGVVSARCQPAAARRVWAQGPLVGAERAHRGQALPVAGVAQAVGGRPVAGRRAGVTRSAAALPADAAAGPLPRSPLPHRRRGFGRGCHRRRNIRVHHCQPWRGSQLSGGECMNYNICGPRRACGPASNAR